MHLDFCVTSFSWLRCCAAASRPDCKLTSSGPSSSLLSPAIARWSEAAAERTVRAVLARLLSAVYLRLRPDSLRLLVWEAQ